MAQAQFCQANVWGTRSEDVNLNLITLSKKRNVLVTTLPVSQHLQGLGFHAEDEIQVVNAAAVNNYEYRIGLFLLCIKASEDIGSLPRFGRILCVISPENSDSVWLGVQSWRTDGLVERFEAYQVSLIEGAPVHLIDVRDLPQHPPISRWRDYSTDRSYLCLKHAVY